VTKTEETTIAVTLVITVPASGADGADNSAAFAKLAEHAGSTTFAEELKSNGKALYHKELQSFTRNDTYPSG